LALRINTPAIAPLQQDLEAVADAENETAPCGVGATACLMTGARAAVARSWRIAVRKTAWKHSKIGAGRRVCSPCQTMEGLALAIFFPRRGARLARDWNLGRNYGGFSCAGYVFLGHGRLAQRNPPIAKI
jgi:hypothetical protein